jgi:hypothetical protein
MTYTEEQKWSVLDQARATLERTSPERLAETRPVFEERLGGASVIFAEPPEDKLTKWRREVSEMEAERTMDREILAIVRSLQDSARVCRQDIASGLAAVNKFATIIKDRLEELTEENCELSSSAPRDQIRGLEAKLRRQASATADVVDVPKPRRA